MLIRRHFRHRYQHQPSIIQTPSTSSQIHEIFYKFPLFIRSKESFLRAEAIQTEQGHRRLPLHLNLCQQEALLLKRIALAPQQSFSCNREQFPNMIENLFCNINYCSRSSFFYGRSTIDQTKSKIKLIILSIGNCLHILEFKIQ